MPPRVLAESRLLKEPLIKPAYGYQGTTTPWSNYTTSSVTNAPKCTTMEQVSKHLNSFGLVDHEEWSAQIDAIGNAFSKGFTPGRRVYRKNDADDVKSGSATADDIGTILGFCARPTQLQGVVGLYYMPVLVRWGDPEKAKHRMPYPYDVADLCLYEQPTSQAPVGDPPQAG